jgi:hypothetical protein
VSSPTTAGEVQRIGAQELRLCLVKLGHTGEPELLLLPPVGRADHDVQLAPKRSRRTSHGGLSDPPLGPPGAHTK